MKRQISILFILLILSLTVIGQQDTLQHITPNRRNSIEQQSKPYVILISADGFRYDYADKYNAEHLLDFSKQGVRAASMMPSYPSVTFPNHYTLVTGLYPAHHGLINNNFYDDVRKERYSMNNKTQVKDGSWYGGTPLWVLAEEQHMLSASMFWVASEADIKNVHLTYYYDYNEKIPIGTRIEIIKNWLLLPEDQRPHFITFYLSNADHAGHMYGPDAPETAEAVKTVDSIVYQLSEAVRTTGLPVNFIFLADHGMTAVDREHPLTIPSIVDTLKFRVQSFSTTAMLTAYNKEDVQSLYEALSKEQSDYKVYLKTNIPPEFHFGAADDWYNRIGDILLLPNWPYVFAVKKPGAGYHGFPPLLVKDMHATFIAWGPAFKTDMRIPTFENVNVFPLITQILKLKNTEKIDGKLEVLKDILK